MSEQPLTGFDNEDATSQTPGERLDEEVFLYDTAAGTLTAPPVTPPVRARRGLRPAASPNRSRGIGLLVDRAQVWAGHWLAASLPGWTKIADPRQPLPVAVPLGLRPAVLQQPRRAVAPDHNAKRTSMSTSRPGSRTARTSARAASATSRGPEGCVGLISSGTASHESAFLDASQAGGEDPQANRRPKAARRVLPDLGELSSRPRRRFDVYDAHECPPGSPCLTAEERNAEALRIDRHMPAVHLRPPRPAARRRDRHHGPVGEPAGQRGQVLPPKRAGNRNR